MKYRNAILTAAVINASTAAWAADNMPTSDRASSHIPMPSAKDEATAVDPNAVQDQAVKNRWIQSDETPAEEVRAKKKAEVKSKVKVTTSCTNSSGVVYQKDQLGYEGCLGEMSRSAPSNQRDSLGKHQQAAPGVTVKIGE
jgi:hypothetical protein